MADNKEIEIKISTDTSDVEQGFKDVSKQADSMSKKIEKSADKIEKSFDDVEKTLKDVQKTMNTTFKNTNFNNVANSMKNAMQKVQNQVKNTANTIKSQLQKALNIQGNIDVKTNMTTDKSGGASNGLLGGMAVGGLTAGAMGSKIAKELAQGMNQGVKQAQEIFGDGIKGVKSEAETLNMVFDGIDDSFIEQMNNIKAEVIPVIEEINEAWAEMDSEQGLSAESFDMVDFANNLKVVQSEIEVAQENFKGLDQGLQLTKKGALDLKHSLNEIAKNTDSLTFGLSDSAKELEKLTRPRRVNTVLKPEEIEHAKQLLQQMNSEVNNLSANVEKINFVDNFDVTQLINSLEQFQQAQTKANAQNFIQELQKAEQEASRFGINIKGANDLIQQFSQIEANGTQLTNEFKNSLIGVGQQFVNYNAQVQANAQAQALMKQRQRELAQQNSTLGKTLVKAKHHLQDFGSAIKNSLSDGALGKIKTTLSSLIKKTKEWVKNHVSASKQIKNANKGMGSSFKSLLSTMLPFASIYGIFNGLKTSITSYVNELANGTRFATVFGNETQEMTEWLENLNSSATTAKSTLMDFSGNLFNMAKNMGMGVEDGKAFAQTMTELGTDLEAFTGDSNSIEALAGALRGEYDSLQNYGFMLSAASVEARALAMGLDSSSESSLALARQAIILEQANMGGVLGYASKHAQTLSGQLAMLRKNFQALGSSIGACFAGLLQVVLPVLNAIVQAVTQAFNKLAQIINSIFGLFGVKVGGASSGGGAIGSAIGGITDSLGSGLGDAAGGAGDIADNLGSASDSAKEIQKSLMGIDEINNLSAPDSGSSGGSGSGSGSGSGGGAGGGLAGGLGDIGFDLSGTESVIDTLARELTDFEKAFLAIFQRIKMGFMAFADEIQSKWSKLKLNIQKLGQTLVEFLTSCWRNGLDDTAMLFGGLLGSITSTMLGIANIVVESAIKLFQHLNPDNNEHVKRFIQAFNDMLLAVIQFVNQADDWLQTFMDNGGQAFLDNMADICFIIGTTLIEALTDAINSLTDFISEDDNKRVKDFAGACEGVSEALKNISLWVQDNIGWLATLGGLILGIWAGMKLGKGAIKAVSLAFEGWGWISGLISGIGAICTWLWTTILVPVGSAIMTGLTVIGAAFGVSAGVVAVAIGAIIAVIALLVANWDWVCEKAGELWKGLQTYWDYIKSTVVNKCTEIKEKAIEIWNNVYNAVTGFVKNLWQGLQTYWEYIKSTVVNKCTEIKNKAIEIWNGIKTSVSNTVTNIKTTIQTKFTEAKTKALEIFDNIKKGIKEKIEWARDKVEEAIEKIKGFFKFEWKLPDIKLPHFKINGEFSLMPPKVPSFGVKICSLIWKHMSNKSL